MKKDNLKNEQQCVIHDVMHSLSYQPTHIKTTVEGRMFLVKAPINFYEAKALYYAGMMDLFDKKHSFDYYLWDFFESNCA
jgi:hypothetical protein